MLGSTRHLGDRTRMEVQRVEWALDMGGKGAVEIMDGSTRVISTQRKYKGGMYL